MFKAIGALLSALAVVGMPLFAVLGGISIVCWLSSDRPQDRFLRRLAANVFDEKLADSSLIVTIPLFVFVGYLMAESKAPQRIVRAASSALGWLPGGLAIVCVLASTIFTMLTAGSGVTIVAIGGLLMPVLVAQGYSKKFAVGLVTSAGAVGLLLPPSPLVLIYCYVARIDPTRTYVALLWPGVLLIVTLIAYCVYTAIKLKIPRQSLDLKVLAKDLWVVKWEALVPVLIVFSLATRLCTDLHEAAAVAAFYTLIVEVYVTRDLSWAKVFKVAKDAMGLSGAIVAIMAMAAGLTNYVVQVELPKHLLEWFVGLGITERWQFVVVLTLFLFLLGTFMEEFSVLLVGLPLLIPLAANFGMHPFYLAALFLLNLELAYISPPVGLNLYISSLRFKRPITDVYRDVLPFCGVLLLGLMVVMVFPRLSSCTVEKEIATLRADAIARGVAPDQAWALECIQQDPPNYRPCTPEDIERYGKDGRLVTNVEAASEADKLAAQKLTDPNVSEEEKRKLRQELGQETEDDLDREFEGDDDDDDDDDDDAPDAGPGPSAKPSASAKPKDDDEELDDDEDFGDDDDDDDEPKPKDKGKPKPKDKPKGK
jgi:C4-dicarboxylate transporter, DctM subunit